MAPQRDSVRAYRFGPFDFDPRAGELLKFGIRIKLQEQPSQVLVMLLAHAGETVTREEIQQKLWPDNTMVEFDHGINAAIKRLRVALGDSADTPKYVETMARRGYRFMASVEAVDPEAVAAPDPPTVARADPALVVGPGAGRNRQVLWGGAAVVMVAAILAVVYWVSRAPGGTSFQQGLVHFLLQPPESAAFTGDIAVSPDGSKLAAVILDTTGVRKLWVRSLSSLDQQILPDTDGAVQPFWSADSKTIGFFAREKLRTVAASGGSVAAIGAALRPKGGTWNSGGTILYCGETGHPLYRVPARGGVSREAVQKAEGEIFDPNSPHFLPDGHRFLFHASSRDAAKAGVFLGSLDSSQRRLLLSGVSSATFVPPDRVVFLQMGSLVTQKVDLDRARSIGASVPAATGNDANVGVSVFSASETGVLVYQTGVPAGMRRLTWRGRDGGQLNGAGEPGAYTEVYLSPDETKASVNLARDGPANLWLLQFDTNVLSPLTFESDPAFDAIWSPDSRRLVYQVNSPSKSSIKTVTLGEQSSKLLWDDGRFNWPDDWSPDGKWILCRKPIGKKISVSLLAADGTAPPKVLFETQHPMDQFQFSPDGQSVAYNSVESGQWEVYVARFPGMTGTQQVSNSGGCQPIWRRDGKELFYLTQDSKVMSVALNAGPNRQPSAPKLLFQSRIPVNCSVNQYAVGSNGQKFLMIEPASEKGPLETREPLHVLINWQAGLRR